MSDTGWLSDAEVEDLTRRRQPCAQGRVLTRWGVPFQRRPDGTLLVFRMSAPVAAGGTKPGAAAANGINWSKQA